MRAGLTQAQLAALAGTSQATLSAYERGAKQPTASTLERLLAVTGGRLVARMPPRVPSPGQLADNARTLEAVLALAEELPVRHARDLRYPRLVA